MARLVEKQMERPTLEQVKEYFKDAKIIRSPYSGDMFDITKKGKFVYYSKGMRYEFDRVYKGTESICIYYKGVYAEIVEYKPKLTKDVPNVLTKDFLRDITEPKHYDNTNGSLYKFCEDKELNSYEFDIIKRVMRCRKKGVFLEDLQKTKVLIDLYIKENEDN